MHEHPTPGAPPIDVAQIFRRFALAYRRTHPLAEEPARVLRDLARCRTPDLGGHLYHCDACGRQVVLYNSCLNRHCPTCQGPAQYRWIEERQRRLLHTPYFHVVFTLPALLRDVAQRHRRPLLALLFRSVSESLQVFARDPRRLGAQPAFTLVLHTWTREILFHPHIHAIVAGGGLSLDGQGWVDVPHPDFLFPVMALSKVFRGKFLHGLGDLCQAGEIDLSEGDARKLIHKAKRQSWVVFAKKPFGGPKQIVGYLGRYTHRVAISSSRLVSISDTTIIFRTRGETTCSVTPDEFIRRFLLHVLPHHFCKIRHYGRLAPANVSSRLLRAQQILGPADSMGSCGDRGVPAGTGQTIPAGDRGTSKAADDGDHFVATDRAAPACPHCGGALRPLSPRTFPFAQRPPPDT